MHDRAWLDGALATLQRARVAVFGDMALDAYWTLEAEHGETSLETGAPVHRVVKQRFGLGGAANIAANLVDLGVAEVRAIGLLGDDPFGARLRAMVAARGIDGEGLLTSLGAWHTTMFAKPMLQGVEQSRFDFGTAEPVSPEDEARLLDALARLTRTVDLVVINQQAPRGVTTAEVARATNEMARTRKGTTFLIDSRDRAELFDHGIVKLNANEARRVVDGDPESPDPVGDAARVHRRTQQPVFVTCGPQGIAVAAEGASRLVPAVARRGPTDPVGAGDTVTAVLAAMLAVQASPLEAAELANLAAAVTIGKMQTTGTATPAEIRALGLHRHGG